MTKENNSTKNENLKSSCIFCKIIKGEIPSSKIYEDDNFLAFLDINPINKGHTLLIPKKHYETYEKMPEELLNKYAIVLQKICKKVINATNAKGYNIFMNNKKVAGQEVPHVHYHILPRHEDDNIKFNFPHKKYDENELNKYQEMIKNA